MTNCDNGGTTDKTKNITYASDICIPGETNFTGHKNHFRMPSAVSGGTGNFWYSFDCGMVHFIQFDTETDLGHTYIGNEEIGGVEKINAERVNATMNAQTNWLEADLKAVNHDVFEPLLIKYNVDLVLSGHSHVYGRQAPLADSVVDKNELHDPESPCYITNDAASHYDGLDPLDTPRKNYSRFRFDTFDATYGWSKLTFHNCTHLTHQFVGSKNGSILDTATLYKNRTCSFGTATTANGTAYLGSAVTASITWSNMW